MIPTYITTAVDTLTLGKQRGIITPRGEVQAIGIAFGILEHFGNNGTLAIYHSNQDKETNTAMFIAEQLDCTTLEIKIKQSKLLTPGKNQLSMVAKYPGPKLIIASREHVEAYVKRRQKMQKFMVYKQQECYMNERAA